MELVRTYKAVVLRERKNSMSTNTVFSTKLKHIPKQIREPSFKREGIIDTRTIR